MKTKKMSEATKNKIRKALTGKNNPMYGRHHDKKTIASISKTVSGKGNPMYGKRHTAEARKKMRLAARRRKLA